MEQILRKQRLPYAIRLDDYDYLIIPMKMEIKNKMINFIENQFKNKMSFYDITEDDRKEILKLSIEEFMGIPDISSQAIYYLIDLVLIRKFPPNPDRIPFDKIIINHLKEKGIIN